MLLNHNGNTPSDLRAAIFHAALRVKNALPPPQTAPLFTQSLAEELSHMHMTILPVTHNPNAPEDLLVNDSVLVRIRQPALPLPEQESNLRNQLHLLGKSHGLIVDFNQSPLVEGIVMVEVRNPSHQISNMDRRP